MLRTFDRFLLRETAAVTAATLLVLLAIVLSSRLATYLTQVASGLLIKEVILQIEGHSKLLEDNPSLESSLDYRLPYFNVLNYVQLEMIKRGRQEKLSGIYESIIHITINGVASGLRNSG